MPVDYGEDFLQRIVGVHWRRKPVGRKEIVFIYAEQEGNQLHYVKFKNNVDTSPQMRTISLPEPALTPQDIRGPRFAINGSSFAFVGGDVNVPDVKVEPVFVLCGSSVSYVTVDDGAGNMIELPIYKARIYRSTDGLSWSKAFEDATSDPSVTHLEAINVTALVWDPAAKTFFYDQNRNSNDQIFSSSNGSGWGMVLSNPTNGDPNYRSPFEAHCEHNVCLDASNQHVPDGVMWQDPELAPNHQHRTVAKPFAPPTITYMNGSIDFLSGTNTVVVERNDILNTINVSIPGVSSVTGIAGAGGVLLAGGYTATEYESPGAVAYSLNRGESWNPLATTPIGVVTIVAGLL
jgi:hypothetical protein